MMSAKDQRNTAPAEDSRVARRDDTADAVRGNLPQATGEQDRQEDGLVFTLEQRLAMLRNETSESALPNPPALHGWHLCWLSTTNKYDNISRRMQMGYEPVRTADMPNFAHFESKGGQFEGCVSVNEMVLFKIPEELWQAYMSESHHDAPNAEQKRLSDSINHAIAEDTRGLVRKVEGAHEDRLVTKRPQFSN